MFGACALGALIIADHLGWLLVPKTDDVQVYDGAQVRVTHVIDGDTIEVDLPDAVYGHARTRIRLWGIDCPELDPDGGAASTFAKQAADLTEFLVGDGAVTLRLEKSRTRGSFGRLLAHVLLEDGSSLNEALLSEGLARADDRWPHRLMMRYAQLEIAAKRGKKGLWAETVE